MIEEIDQDAGVTLVQIDADDQGRFDDEVQVTPTHVSAQGEAHSQEDQPKDQLGVLKAYQFFDDMLKAFDRDDLVMLWSLVKELFSSTKPTDDKERTLWVELKRLFKPDTDDTLWKLHKVGIADNTGHNVVEHTQVGCRLPIVQQYKPPPCAQTLPGTYPSDMTVYTPSALSPLSVSPSYPSYHTNLA
nr:hypothetical protein [Tanacetum cinerariifolium]